jgi:hypothetical protein
MASKSLTYNTNNSHDNNNNNANINNQIMSNQNEKLFKSIIFPIPFEKLWSFVKSPSKYSLITNNIAPGVFVNPLTISKNKFIDINNQFIIEIDEQIEITFTILNIIETDYFSRIKWNITTNINTISLTLIISLSIIDDEHTLYGLSYLPSNKESKSNEPFVLSILVHKRFDIYLYYTKIYNYFNTCFQSNTESSIISAGFVVAKEYFLNSEVCTNMMGEYVSSTEERVKKGTIVVYINSKDNKKWLIHVRHCLVKKNSCFLIFFIYEAHHSMYPQRELKVELFSVNDNETFVVLTHNFLKPLSKEEIHSLSMSKKKMLKKLGSVIEKSFKMNYSEIGASLVNEK